MEYHLDLPPILSSIESEYLIVTRLADLPRRADGFGQERRSRTVDRQFHRRVLIAPHSMRTILRANHTRAVRVKRFGDPVPCW